MSTIPTGLHWVEAPCPRCGQVEIVAVHLSSVLTVPQDDSPKVKAKVKATDHDCEQERLPT